MRPTIVVCTAVQQPCPLRPSLRAWAVVRLGALLICSTMSGCASTSGGDGIVGKTMEMLGLKVPQTPEEAQALVPVPRTVTLRVHAGDQLNTDGQMRSLSVVMRIYKLRRIDAFLAAPYTAFGDPAAEKQAFGDDVVDAREVVMRPGQRHEVLETMPVDAAYIAVATLFRAPADGRWRFAFDAKQAAKTGITLGLHGCAISVAAGAAERAPPEVLRLAGVQCR
ncbi:MAG: type VI secretion system lipoprotein TssJ [Rubrivivax sp.]|nr:type VI secretion system lipoprotein TssJ [Rubrivivax sp.]